MKKLLLILIIAFSCDTPKPSMPYKKADAEEIKLVNPWIDFQTQYNHKIKSKNQEGC